MITVRVQAGDFDTGAEIAALHAGRSDIGAVASFTGLVRGDGGLTALTLEHYPAMTEKALTAIAAEAEARWPLQGGIVIHRHGRLAPGDRIVLVATASAHRKAAFDACEFLMDWLKTKAPFWKREENADGNRWVEAKQADDEVARDWLTPRPK